MRIESLENSEVPLLSGREIKDAVSEILENNAAVGVVDLEYRRDAEAALMEVPADRGISREIGIPGLPDFPMTWWK